MNISDNPTYIQAVLDNVADGIITIDAKGRIQSFNRAAEVIFGYSEEEVVGKNIAILMPDEMAAMHDMFVRAYIDTGESKFIDVGARELTAKRKDGSTFPSDIALSEMVQGGERYFIGIVRDLAQQKASQAVIRETLKSLTTFREALDVSADSIFLIDPETVCFVDFNEAAIDTLGYSRGELLTMGPQDINPDYTKAQIQTVINRVLHDGEEGTDIVTRHRRKSGEDLPVDIRLSALREEGGKNTIVAVARDISERMAIEQALRESERYNRMLFENSPMGLALCRMNGELVDINRAYADIIGRSVAETLKLSYWDITPEKYVQQEQTQLETLKANGRYGPYVKEYIHRDGHLVPVKLNGLLLEQQGESFIWSSVEDITLQKEAEEELRRSQALLIEAQHISQLGSWEWNIVTGVITWSEEVYRIFGHEPYAFEATYERFLEHVHPIDRDSVSSAVAQSLESKKPYSVEHRLVRPDKQERIVHERGEAYYDEQGNAVRMVGTVQDITEQKMAEARLEYMSNFDTLTGLPNRKLLRDRIEHALQQAHRHEHLVAIMFLDLDRFKNINDTMGHHIGDELLKVVAQRITQRVREGDTVARLGGDEFVVVLEGISHVDHAALVAEDIIDVLNEPVHIERYELFPGASIGITIYPFDDDNIDDLLKDADTAMYRAKAAGRNQYQYFTADMTAEAIEHMRLEHDLRHALERKEFELHYQPQVTLDGGELVGVEALLRWNHPERGMVSPAVFVPILEESGMILPVGEWVLRSACEQGMRWQEEGLGAIRIGVNISAKQFHLKNFPTQVKRALRDAALDARLLDLEITEGTLVEEVETTIETMKLLHAMGIKLSIDDFGTGYSSLSYLKRFPLHTLKIDQSFVRDINADSDSASIARSIIALGRSMRLNVIAEGIETQEHLDFMKRHGCDEGQGFFFSRPLPPNALYAWWQEYRHSQVV